MADQAWLQGRVIRTQSGFFWVETEAETYRSEVRGSLLKNRLDTDPVALGDIVRISLRKVMKNDTVTHHGLIEEVLPRERAFTRQMPAPEGRRARADQLPDREKVIIANPDQVVFVFACANPAPRVKMLDRFLVIAERAHIPVIICANKFDLVSRKEARDLFGIYDAIGYEVIYTSAEKGKNVNKLKKQLSGKISALTGPSGVGKTSLLNAMQPDLGLTVKAVSEATTKGRHTTVSSHLVSLEDGGYVADTPGIRQIGLFNIEPAELDGYFREIAPYVGNCQFSDCRHFEEPGCAVVEAVKEGYVWWERYESYCRLREEAEEIFYRC